MQLKIEVNLGENPTTKEYNVFLIDGNFGQQLPMPNKTSIFPSN
jgi:hypothetical protein